MNFIVSDQIDELLVGIDWMRDNGCVLSFADLTLELQGYRFPLLTKTRSGTCNRVILEEGVVLPAKSKTMVSCKVVYADLHKRLPAVGITGNKECAPGVKTARCLLELGSGTHLPLRVLNVSNRPVSLQEGMTPCPLQEVESVIEEQQETITENSPVEFVADRQERFRSAYEIVRNHLKTTAKKRKSVLRCERASSEFRNREPSVVFLPETVHSPLQKVEFRIHRTIYCIAKDLGLVLRNSEVQEG